MSCFKARHTSLSELYGDDWIYSLYLDLEWVWRLQWLSWSCSRNVWTWPALDRPQPHAGFGLLGTKMLHEHVHGGCKSGDEQVLGDQVERWWRRLCLSPPQPPFQCLLFSHCGCVVSLLYTKYLSPVSPLPNQLLKVISMILAQYSVLSLSNVSKMKEIIIMYQGFCQAWLESWTERLCQWPNTL